jgi:hypothetical protein
MAEEKKVDAMEEEQPSVGGGVAAASSGVRFEIKKWNAVTMWSWDICTDTCAICRNSLNEPSIEYQVINCDGFHGDMVLIDLYCRSFPRLIESCIDFSINIFLIGV